MPPGWNQCPRVTPWLFDWCQVRTRRRPDQVSEARIRLRLGYWTFWIPVTPHGKQQMWSESPASKLMDHFPQIATNMHARAHKFLKLLYCTVLFSKWSSILVLLLLLRNGYTQAKSLHWPLSPRSSESSFVGGSTTCVCNWILSHTLGPLNMILGSLC